MTSKKPDIQPFQYISVKQAYEAKKFLIADEMGMFKTAQAVLVNNKIREKKRKTPTLVVCPTSVKQHWSREIERWSHPKNQSVVIIDTQNFESDAERAKKADWVVLHYALLSQIDPKRLKVLQRMGFEHLILDEVHNAKNPAAIRTQAVKTLADKADNLTLLSGTPIPNTIEDIYMLMHLLEPTNFPLTGKQDIDSEARQRFIALYFQRPQEFKELLHRRMISRSADQFIPQKLPELEERVVELEMSGKWLDVYDQILERPLPAGRKIMQLEKALLDTSLVDSDLVPDAPIVQPKYVALDEIIQREVRRGGKILVFTNLKEGVVPVLLERYKKYGAIAITGDVPAYGSNEREKLRQQFQQDPDTKVLIATTVMNEGVDLTAASAVVNLMLPWMPADYLQRIKRAHRPGEVRREKVTVYNLVARYPKRIRKSLDEAMLDMLNSKRRVIEYLRSGIKISREELMEMQEPGKIPRIRLAIRSDNQIIFKHYLNWRGIGTQSANRRANRNAAKGIAKLYLSFSMARNAAELYLPIIRLLQPSEPWLDLAGNLGMLAYYAERPTHVLDIDQNALREGKKLKTGDHVRASFASIPYRDNSFGLLVCSLAFQMSEPRTERARVLQEMNRVLKKGGYAIITLPPNYQTDKDRAALDRAMNTYGFNILREFYATDLGPSNLELYVLQKQKDARKRTHNLTLEGDRVVGR